MQEFQLNASDGEEVACYHWVHDNPRGVVLIAHGMGEHAKRYDRVAQALNGAGYAVIANDHRGHGITGQAKLGYMGPDGWNRVLADAYEINCYARQCYPDVAVVLFGHSMGSMMSQQYITRYGASIDALVLSGSPGFKAKSYNPLPRWILSFENRRVGPDGASAMMQKVIFGGANKPFDAADATGFEWLSRDTAEVNKYIEDEFCGFVIATASLVDLYAGSAITVNPHSVANIPKELPVYVFSGEEDPVHGGKADVQRMLEAFSTAGLTKVEMKWYPGGRHEMLNETNAEEVTRDLLGWLERTLDS